MSAGGRMGRVEHAYGNRRDTIISNSLPLLDRLEA